MHLMWVSFYDKKMSICLVIRIYSIFSEGGRSKKPLLSVGLLMLSIDFLFKYKVRLIMNINSLEKFKKRIIFCFGNASKTLRAIFSKTCF